MKKVELLPIKGVPDDRIGFAVVMARTACGWLYVRRRDRQTWEIPGGHREQGETIRRTAERELYEETGAEASVMEPVWAYSVDDGGTVTYGTLFFAEVGKMNPLPESEIAEVTRSESLPAILTYPDIQPVLFEAGCAFAYAWDYTMADVF